MNVSLLFILIFSVIIRLSLAVKAKPAILTGQVAHVRDGDTIEVGKIPISEATC